MIIEYDVFNVCSAYVTAIEYSDYSGLDDNDEKLVNDWLDNLPDGYKYFQWSEESYFCKDSISGLMADCLECKVFINHANI